MKKRNLIACVIACLGLSGLASCSGGGYTATFVNYDGTVLKTTTIYSTLSSDKVEEYKVSKSDAPEDNPIKPIYDGEYYFDFTGYNPDISKGYKMTGDTTFTAVYEKKPILTYKFNEDVQTYAVKNAASSCLSPISIIKDNYDDGTNGFHPVTSILKSAFDKYSSLEDVTISSN